MTGYSRLGTDFIAERFPGLKAKAQETAGEYDSFLPHVVFGDVFNELTAELLKREDWFSDSLLRDIFDMYEELSSSEDKETQNLVQVTLLEYLWDEKLTFDRALKIMGKHTREIWDNIYGYLNVPRK